MTQRSAAPRMRRTVKRFMFGCANRELLNIAPAADALARLRILEHRVLSVNLVLRLEVVRVGCGPVEIQSRSNLTVFHLDLPSRDLHPHGSGHIPICECVTAFARQHSTRFCRSGKAVIRLRLSPIASSLGQKAMARGPTRFARQTPPREPSQAPDGQGDLDS